MWKVPFRARDRFDQDQRGNVAVLFAVSAIPLIGLLGGAVDITRHQRHKVELLNAMDSAAIALTRRSAENDVDADAFVNDYISALLSANRGDPMLHVGDFNATQVAGGYQIQSNATMDTAFMPLIGIREMRIDLTTEVMTTGGKYEVALALDNTGSMRFYGRMPALRDAATQLVDDLYSEDGTDERVKMALVPFVTSVNVGHSDGFDSAWIDPVGSDPVYHLNFSAPVNRLDLFDEMHVGWKGCVESRFEDDLDDTAPTSPATRWVPYLWPDEPDWGYGNSYLTDSRGTRGDRERLRDIAKYDVGRSTSVPDTTNNGPNAACPGPVIPLTNDTELMKREIRKMKPHNEYGGNNSGTNVAQGLVWAWRVLSPGEPFTGGAPYEDEETQKALILLSDGRNQVVSNGGITESDYTSYGYLADGRMGSTDDYLVAEANVDEKVKEVCAKVKAEGIRLYTILFQVDFQKTQDLFRECASKNDEGEPLYYYVPSTSDLQTAFSDIGKDLTSLRITR
jgi:Flp pilus assembly protein TadG